MSETDRLLREKDDEIQYHIEINLLLFNGKQEANLANEVLRLKKALKELHEKLAYERCQAQIDLNNAFRDGFRCVKKI